MHDSTLILARILFGLPASQGKEKIPQKGAVLEE